MADRFKAEVVDGETPKRIGKTEIAVLLSHGSRGQARTFAGVDDVGQFTVEELADWLGECACVVLFVCHAGRNDGRLLNNEAFGLISHLLRRDVRAVIASPAPLHNKLPSIWLLPFLEQLRRGETIGAAHSIACAVVREQFDHPCAWGALQLFGDSQLRFSVSEADENPSR